MFWLLAFGAGGYFFWTDVVDTLPGSGLVGWCLDYMVNMPGAIKDGPQ